MMRTFLALALASVSCAAIAGPPGPPPVPVDVNVTNPVLPVEISNADPVPVVSTEAETTLENFNASIAQTGSAGSTQIDFPVSDTTHLTGLVMQVDAGGTTGRCSAHLAVYEDNLFRDNVFGIAASPGGVVVSPYVPLPNLLVPAGHKLVLTISNSTGAFCAVNFNLYSK